LRATSAVSSSASAIVTRPISRAVTSARTRLSCSSARRKIVRGWPCEVDVLHLRGRDGEASLERHSPTRGGGSPKAPAGQAAFSPRRLFRGSDPSQLSHLVIPVARRSKSGPELVCMPLQTPGERAGSPPKRAGNVTPTGEAAELTCREDLVKPGPGVWPLRLAKRQRWGEDGRSPGFSTFLPLRRDKIKRSIKRPAPTLERPSVSRRLVSYGSARSDLVFVGCDAGAGRLPNAERFPGSRPRSSGFRPYPRRRKIGLA
jgi:hypothetical protein